MMTRPHVAEVQVGPANVGRGNLDHEVPRPDGRPRHIVEPQVTSAVDHRHLHRRFRGISHVFNSVVYYNTTTEPSTAGRVKWG